MMMILHTSTRFSSPPTPKKTVRSEQPTTVRFGSEGASPAPSKPVLKWAAGLAFATALLGNGFVSMNTRNEMQNQASQTQQALADSKANVARLEEQLKETNEALASEKQSSAREQHSMAQHLLTLTQTLKEKEAVGQHESERIGKLEARPAFDAARKAIITLAKQSIFLVTPTQTLREGVQSLGTVSILNVQGKPVLVTNAHVAKSILDLQDTTQTTSPFTLTALDGQKYQTTLKYVDEEIDLAVLDVPKELESQLLKVARPLATIDRPNWLEDGTSVVAAGHPFGMRFLVTEGISTLVDRKQNEITGIPGYEYYPTLIHNTSSTNHGNSGGPLVDFNGAVIGINQSTRVNTSGISFAIPAEAVWSSFFLHDIVEPKTDIERGLKTQFQAIKTEAVLKENTRKVVGQLVSEMLPPFVMQQRPLKPFIDHLIDDHLKPNRDKYLKKFNFDTQDLGTLDPANIPEDSLKSLKLLLKGLLKSHGYPVLEAEAPLPPSEEVEKLLEDGAFRNNFTKKVDH